MSLIRMPFCVSASSLVFVTVAAATAHAANYYVSAGGTAPEGSAYDAVFTDIAAAVTAASDGDRIVVAAETFTFAAELTVGKAVTVIGEDRDLTLVQRTVSTKFRLLKVDHADALIANMTVQGGWPDKNFGGNILVTANGGTVSNCVIRNGTTFDNTTGGGGIALQGGLATHCIITNNVSTITSYGHSGGGGVNMSGRSVVDTCLVAGNRGGCSAYFQIDVGGVLMQDNAVLRNSTIVGNTAPGWGGVLLYAPNKLFKGGVTNCLLAGNTARLRGGLADIYGLSDTAFPDSTNAFFACASTLKINEHCHGGCIDFVDASVHDWTPRATSIAIGNACVLPGMAGATDLLGHPRVVGGVADIGAIQHIAPASFTCEFSPDATVRAAPFSVQFAAVVSGSTSPFRCTWIFGDGSDPLVAESATATHTYTTPGTYTVTLTAEATDSSGDTDTLTRSGLIHVAPATIYVKTANAGAAAPYDTWATATTDLRTAIDTAADGSVIVVDDGDYPVNSLQLDLDKAVTLQSHSGDPFKTRIYRSATSTTYKYRVIQINHPDARLTGMTVSHGYLDNNATAQGGNILIENRGGTVSNCVIRNGTSKNNNSCGAGICAMNGLVTHCVISNNLSSLTAYLVRGGAATLITGELRNCLIANNVAVNSSAGVYGNTGGAVLYGGLMQSCTIVGNTGCRYGGVNLFGATARVLNCAISDNATSNPDAGETDSVYGLNSGAAVAAFENCASTILINGTCFAGSMSVNNALISDWRPDPASICLDKASVQTWMADARDLDGNPRIAHRKPDIGCYERIYITPGTILLVR